MDGQSLVTAVEFDEVKKGYDPEQVENYLEQLGERLTLLATNLRKAVDRAEAAEARAAAALKERDAAREQAEAAERRAASSSGGGDDGTESIKKMLMLAQRTADSAVEEAQASAKNIVADARSKAAEIVGDAEQRAERLLIEAQKVGDEMMQEKSAAIVRTVTELEARRDALLTDTSALSRHLDEQRGRLADALASLAALADDGGMLRASPLPELEVSPDAPRAASLVGDDDAPAAPAPATSTPAGRADEAPLGGGSTGGGGTPPTSAAPSGPAGATGGAADVIPVAPSTSGTVPITPATSEAQRATEGDAPKASLLVADHEADGADDLTRVVRSAELIEAPARPPLFDAEVDAPELDLARDTRELTPAERVSLFADPADADPLGPGDDQADEAMRRFFEEGVPDAPKKRFRRS